MAGSGRGQGVAEPVSIWRRIPSSPESAASQPRRTGEKLDVSGMGLSSESAGSESPFSRCAAWRSGGEPSYGGAAMGAAEAVTQNKVARTGGDPQRRRRGFEPASGARNARSLLQVLPAWPPQAGVPQ
jgi:hypothetical protein